MAQSLALGYNRRPPMTTLDPDEAKALLRWRLALGREVETVAPSLALEALFGTGEGQGLDPAEAESRDLDETLDFVYGRQKGSTRLRVPEWLSRVRGFFREGGGGAGSEGRARAQGFDPAAF